MTSGERKADLDMAKVTPEDSNMLRLSRINHQDEGKSDSKYEVAQRCLHCITVELARCRFYE